jgi:unsaturated chondroitin disaccharide hydrolase
MNTLTRIILAAALSIAGAASADPIPQKIESKVGYKAYDLPAAQTGTFELVFDATPMAERIDGFAGVSASVPYRPSEVAVIVRFSPTGVIDARNGANFASDQVLNYAANKSYHVRVVVDTAKKTYSVFVASAGEPEVALAKNYAFRDGQGSVRSLEKFVLASFRGSAAPLQVSGVSLK